MLAVESPRAAAHKKPSLFRRFSRRPSPERVAHNNDAAACSSSSAVRPASRLRKTCPPAIAPEALPLPTPPLSPACSKTDSVIDVSRCPSPHLTRDKKHRKGHTVVTTQRVDMPQVQLVRERIARGSSAPSSSSSSSKKKKKAVRVKSTALYTMPFPASPQARVRVTTWDVFLLPAQVHALYLGYRPYEMGGQWFVYSEGPDAMGKLKVHFHRSLTGIKVAELFLVMDVKGEGAGKIVGIKWNGGEEVGSGRMSGHEARYLVRNVVQSVFGFELEDGY